VPVVLRMPDPPVGEQAAADVSHRSIARAAGMPGLALGLVNTAYAAVVGFLIVHLETRGGGGAAALAIFSGVVLFGRVLVVPLVVRAGSVAGMAGAVLAVSGGCLIVAQSGGLTPVIIGVVLFAVGYCVPYPLLASLVVQRVPAAGRARALGALVAVYDACVGGGAVLFGQVSDSFDTAWVFRLAAAISLVGGIVAVGVVRRQRVRDLTHGGEQTPDA
jgi:MFS family permease